MHRSTVVPLRVLLQDGGTALTVASQYGHSRVVETLLKNGANVHDQLNVSCLCIFSLSLSLSVLPHSPALTVVWLVSQTVVS